MISLQSFLIGLLLSFVGCNIVIVISIISFIAFNDPVYFSKKSNQKEKLEEEKEQTVIFRELPKSITQALTSQENVNVNYQKALEQHNHYIDQIQELVPNSIILSPLEEYPDSCFVEDTMVNLKSGVVVLTNPSAPSRKGEAESIANLFIDDLQLNQKSSVYQMKNSSDGGDVLVIDGKYLFVGDSSRSQVLAHQEWEQICSENDMIFSTIKVNDALHLKSLVTYLGPKIGLVAVNNKNGQQAVEQILATLDFCPPVNWVNNTLAANMLRVKNHVFCQNLSDDVRVELENKYQDFKFVLLDMSELAKVDGALTCCSVFIK